MVLLHLIKQHWIITCCTCFFQNRSFNSFCSKAQQALATFPSVNEKLIQMYHLMCFFAIYAVADIYLYYCRSCCQSCRYVYIETTKRSNWFLFIINTLIPRQNCRHFSWKWKYENSDKKFHWIFVPTSEIDIIPSLVQIMAWCWQSDKPLSELILISLLTHVCVTRPQWFKGVANTLLPRPRADYSGCWIRVRNYQHLPPAAALTNMV